MNNNKKMSQPNLMKKKSSNSLKLVLSTECGECTVLKDTVEGLHKTVSKFEEMFNNYKNDTNNKIGELHKELEDIKNKSKIEIGNLQRDNIEILAPLRTRQLIEAGRILFYKKFGAEYRKSYPSKVSRKPPSSRYITPDDWTHFVSFVSFRCGSATYWNLLEGGDYSQFGNSSATIHCPDKYKIAEYFKTVGNIPRDYSDLFKKVFKSSVYDVCPN
jgi:hypothetical protein